MSDSFIRLAPASVAWQPSAEAAAAATAYVTSLFAGPDAAADDVGHEFYDRITLIDAGSNTHRVTCPRCDGDIPADWLDAGHDGDAFDDLDAPVPCCGAVVPLNTLSYDWPVAFARFEISAMNATRPSYELDDTELAEVSALLGHPVVQILAHY